MIRQCRPDDLEDIHAIINEAAGVYREVIPADRWKVPYMSRDELLHEIGAAVVFWGYEEEDGLVAVMGIQDVLDVTLIRHAYVRPIRQKHGIGGKMLSFLRERTTRPLLIGTWANASWAIRFYEKHGFVLVSAEQKDQLLKKYWSVPDRQIETSVVLQDQRRSRA